MLMRLGEFSKNFHVSLRRLSIFTMYLILSPVSAHARANLLQIQWKLRRTLLTRFNLASTPLCSPVMTLAPSLTNDSKFLTSKSHSFNVSNIWLVITSAFAPRGSSMHLVARNSVLVTPMSGFTYFRKIINCWKTVTLAASSARIPRLLALLILSRMIS